MNINAIQVFEDTENFGLPKDISSLDKIDENTVLETGKRIYWYHKTDLEYFEDMGESPEDYPSELFTGICVPVPYADGNRELNINDIIVIIDSYPSEKNAPEVLWVSFNRLLDAESLVKVFSIGEDHKYRHK